MRGCTVAWNFACRLPTSEAWQHGVYHNGSARYTHVPPIPTRDNSAHLCQAGKVYEGQVEDVGAVYAEVDGELADALVLASDAEGLLLDLAADVVEVGVAFVDVEELAPFCDVGRVVGDESVNELEDEGSAGDDAGAAGEEVTADDAIIVVEREGRRDWVEDARFEDAGLSCRLATDL